MGSVIFNAGSNGECLVDNNLEIVDGISVQLHAKLPLIGDIAVESKMHWIISKGLNASNSTWALYYKRFGSTYCLGIYLKSTSGGHEYQIVGGLANSLADNNWHQIGFTRVGGTVKLYIDFASTEITTTFESGSLTNIETLQIGQTATTLASIDTIQLDEIQIWNRALSDVDTSFYGHKTLDTSEISDANLIAYYNCNEDSDITIYDKTTNDNAITLTNGVWSSENSSIVPDTLPEAINVDISGIEEIGEILTGHYEYNDTEGDPESLSTFKWYRADTMDGSYTEISGATNITYTTTIEDVNKYIKFEVTPHSI